MHCEVRKHLKWWHSPTRNANTEVAVVINSGQFHYDASNTHLSYRYNQKAGCARKIISADHLE